MKERPILFSAPMVQALLAGRKTQTRRIAAARGRLVSFDGITARLVDEIPDDPVPANVRHRFGVPGDRLWVRETWASGYARGCWGTIYAQDKSFGQGARSHEKGPHFNHEDNFVDIVRWRPSIFMPRWASRIALEVTSVRIERLNTITDDDARAEGVDNGPGRGGRLYPSPRAARAPLGYREVFRELWDTINGKRAPWASNPWVWVVAFKRIKP